MQQYRQRLEDYLLAQVPVARAMQVRVQELSATGIALHAPLACNDNHKGTAFGGSQYALAALAGWGLLVAQLWSQELDGEIVIRDGEIRYREPVDGDLVLDCGPRHSREIAEFLERYRRQRVARITLFGRIAGRRGLATEFRGHYVAGV